MDCVDRLEESSRLPDKLHYREGMAAIYGPVVSLRNRGHIKNKRRNTRIHTLNTV